MGIEAGSGIEAGLSIFAKTISSKYRIFAGLCTWKFPDEHETLIQAKLLEGTVAFGKLIDPSEEIKKRITLELTDEQLVKIQEFLK